MQVQATIAKASASTLSGKIDIANSPHSQVILEFAEGELVEWKVISLKDTGADIDMVTASLVATLEQMNLVKPFKLDTPIQLGAVNTDYAFTITHAVKLPIREGDTFYEHTFAIAPIPAPPHLIMGQPWLQTHCPEALKLINNFGIQEIASPEFRAQTMITPDLTRPTITPSLEPQESRKLVEPSPIIGFEPDSRPMSPMISLTADTTCQQPIPLNPCKTPLLAFSAGGDNPTLAAIESEEFRRKEGQEKYVTCMTARIHIDIALQRANSRVKAAPASQDRDPGTRGLTGNKDGWLETIPPEFRHFANTVFSDSAADELPQHRPNSDCQINIRQGAKLNTTKIYNMSQEELTTLKQLLDLELKRGFIRPSKSESSAPVFFVRDPSSGTRSGQLRLVVDYRDLNQKIELDDYPIPLTRTVMNDLAGADHITSMDVRSGFATLRMAPGSEAATAFKTFYGLYEYTVMPMGLATAPSVFQRFINSVLNAYLGIFCHAYLDDIVIYTKGTLEKHKEHVRLVLQTLADNQLRLKPHKCKWFRKQCDFLGFTVVCGKGIRMADDKIQGIRNMQPPRGLSDLRHFLGVLGFYDKFIPRYSEITSCLTNLTKKDVPWKWDENCQKAFDRLLAAVRDDVYLRGFNPTLPIRFSTDASDAAYAGVLEQQYPDGWFPFLLFHHKFKEGEKNWDIHDKELYAIVHGFKQYRHFLAQSSQPVQVFTDHRNLAKFMFSSNLLKSHDGRLGHWWETLSQCNFVINYKPGEENVFPDFLSRYGQEVSIDLEPRCLLPKDRFSPKALADIESWFKKTPASPNIRSLLEAKFAEGKIQNSSPVPVPEPVTPLSRLPKERLVIASMTTLQQRLARSMGLTQYQGHPLSEIISMTHTRQGPDKRGLGAPPMKTRHAFRQNKPSSPTHPTLPLLAGTKKNPAPGNH